LRLTKRDPISKKIIITEANHLGVIMTSDILFTFLLS
jgi:hypothetical protein